ncbi:uncharacterized protein LOC128671948 isoform X2 [Plodia interpunctella]|nr:uncharacterized protein LOC128671948 isoform X2 [Plodia interpunctella]
MPTCSLEHTEAVRRYYAAFPALKKGQESPLQYYLPPPAWCRKSPPDCKQAKMQSEIALSRDWNAKNKKLFTGKERRNSYHGQRKGKKRCNSYSRSFESKESLPEWVTHEGVWDIETQDPVKEFIKAIALDEGYGTCENTVTDEIKEITSAKLKMNESMVPNWDDSIDFDADWIVTEDVNPRVRTPMEEELYAKFEAKFDRSIEALWTKDQNTPDDEYQDLPIDFQDLLSSPSDHLFADPSAEKCSLISLTESIWSNDAADVPFERAESTSKIAEALHDRLKPLQLADAEPEPCPPRVLDSLALYDGDDLYDALASVAQTMRSFTAINHSRDRSGFVEVPPRRRPRPARPSPPHRPPDDARPPASAAREDLLISSRTHFKPIRREAEADAARYADGDSFDISGDLDPVEFSRSESGGVYLKSSLERYLEYRTGGIDYGRLNLTAAQRCPDLDDPGFRLRFPMRQLDAAVQTESAAAAWDACEECGCGAKKMRADPAGVWGGGGGGGCAACGAGLAAVGGPPGAELAQEWEELVSAMSAARAQYAADAALPADRKRRHSAALRCAAPACSHPHARFLPCCTPALDRPLTR